MNRNVRLAPLLLLVLLPFAGMAQFIYVGPDLGYQRIKFDGKGNKSTANDDIRFGLTAMWRPLRALVIGARYEMPVSQKRKFSFEDAPTPDGSDFRSFRISDEAYQPLVYSYTIKQSGTTSILLRLVSNTPVNFYAEGRLSMTTFDESFKLWRFVSQADYDEFGSLRRGYLPGVNIEEDFIHKMVSPGLRLGLMPQFKGGFYMDINVGYDFYGFDSTRRYSYTVEHDWDIVLERHELVTFESQLRGSKKAFSTCIGFGAFF